MHTTAATPITETTSSTGGQRRAVGRWTTAGLSALALVAVAVPAAGDTAAGTAVPLLGGCTLTPTANSMSFDVTALMTTVRITDGVVEMLHDARCADGRAGTVWIAADII